MDMRYDMRSGRQMDGRNPYGSRGGYVVSSRGRRGRGRRGDRGMDMNYDMARGGRGGDRADYGDYEDMARGRRDYGDMRGDYRQDYAMQDGHYPKRRQGNYEPVEFMGYCSGYYGMPQDYARGDYARYDRGYSRDYGDYDDYGDYGETLSEEELEKWCKKLKGELSESEKQMFSKEMISQKARQMGKEMKGFGEKELEVATLMCYTDYKHTIGQNPDMAIMLAFDWLNDKDVAVKGAEKLAVYYDCIVEGE